MSQLTLSGGAILLALGLAPSIEGQTMSPEPQEVCRFSESLTVHVLFDNTTTVRDSVSDVWERLDAWLRALESSLRPDDRIEILRLAYTATDPRTLEQAPFALTVRRTADRIPEVVEWMRGDEATKTDLAEALEYFRVQRHRAQSCGEVLLLVTDGSLDPRDSAQGPQGAVTRLADAVGDLRDRGWSVFAVQIDDDDDDRVPPAFDNDFRRRVPESTRRVIHRQSLSASDMLERTFGPSNVISWERHEKIAALLYERDESPFVRHRKVVWARPGLTLRDLTRSGVTNVLYAQTDDNGDDAYRGCSGHDGSSDDHLVLGPANACYHLLTAPADSLLEHLADVSTGRFGWRAIPSLGLRYSGRLVHPAQFRVLTADRRDKGCGVGEVPFENAHMVGGSEFVVVTVRFVKSPGSVWTDTMQALDQSGCFLLWNPKPVGAQLAHRAEDTLYVRLEHYSGPTLVARSHHFLVGRVIPLEWTGQVTSLLPFFALRLERWHVRAGISLPSWAQNAQLKLEGQRFDLERAVGSCAEESHNLACFRFDEPTYERSLPRYGTIAFAPDADVDCSRPNAACITLPVRTSGLTHAALFTNDRVIDLLIFAAFVFSFVAVGWDASRRNTRQEAQGSVEVLTRAFRLTGLTAALLITGAELVSWWRETDHFFNVFQVTIGGTVLLLGLLLPVFCDVVGDIVTAMRELIGNKSVQMTTVVRGAMLSSYVALAALMMFGGNLPVRFVVSACVVLLARPMAAAFVWLFSFGADPALAVREQEQAPSSGGADPASSPAGPAEPTVAALSGEAAGASDEAQEKGETVSGEREDGAASSSGQGERFLPVHNATLGTGAATGAVDSGDLEGGSSNRETHTTSVFGEEAASPGPFASLEVNSSDRPNVQQVSLSEEELPF